MVAILDSLGLKGEYSVTRLGIALPNPFATSAFTIFTVLVVDVADPMDHRLLSSGIPTELNNCLVLGTTVARRQPVDLTNLTESPLLPPGKIFGTGRVKMGTAISSLNRPEHSSTAGLYFRFEDDSNNDVYCLSTAHRVGISQGTKYPSSNLSGLLRRIMAPSAGDQQRFIKYLGKTAESWRSKIERLELTAATTTDRSIREREHGLLAVLRCEKHSVETQLCMAQAITESDRIFGDLVCGQNEVIPGQTRLDWAIIKIFRQLEKPSDVVSPPSPKNPAWYKLSWKLFTGEIDVLLLDSAVRKTGQQSGTTFGIIGAKRAGRTSEGDDYTEMFALSEAAVGFNPAENFAVPGDSGSAVLNTEGKAVGLVQGRYTLSDLEVITTPAGILDLPGFASAREDSGALRDAVNMGRPFHLTRITPLDAVLCAVAAAVGVEVEKLCMVM